MLSTRTMLMLANLMLSAAVSQAFDSEPVEDLLAATVRITDGENSGTCFFVSEVVPDQANPRQVVLATAAHVFEQMNKPECDLILRSGTLEQGFRRTVISIDIRDADKPLWFRHPELDVAVISIELPADAFFKAIPLSQIADEERIVNRTVRVGQEAWVACFPAKLEANEAGWPVLRKGSIATHPLFPLKSAKTILIDYNVFGGDSGAPVAVVIENRLLVVGIASSMQRQTDKTSLPFEERIMHTPLGLSIAVQAAYLRETIQLMKAK